MSHYYNKKVLVTGGGGFIGSHIVRALHTQRARVVVLDNLSNSSENIVNEIRVLSEFIEGDICDIKTCLRASKDCFAIFHCAAFISVPLSFQTPELCYEVNIRGTENLLLAAHSNHVSHFVFSSSAAVYGNQEQPCCESMKPQPCSPYAESKVEGEKLCTLYSSKLSSVSLRYFNVYDLDPTHQSGNSVIALFCKKITNNEPVTMYGDGTQSRDFIHVEAVARANLAVGIGDVKGEIFNIASGTSMTLFELFSALKTKFSCPSIPLLFEKERVGDIKISQANCSKYQQFASSNLSFPLNFTQSCRGGEIGRHARFRF